MLSYQDYNMLYSFPEVAFEKDYIVATYQVVSASGNAEKLAMAIADEQTTGTWTKVKYETADKKRKFGGQVLNIFRIPPVSDAAASSETVYIIQIGFPVSNFAADISMLLTTVIGNISASGKLKLLDLSMPKSYVERFQGPKFGIPGIRDVLNVHDRPLLNCMIKPCLSWTPDEGAELFYEAAVGGVDIVKDDELLSADMPYCPLKERVTKFMEKERQAYEETGEHTLYTVNITTDPAHLKENAYRALEYGANALMLNFYTVGLAGARMITEDPNINVPILAHVDFSAATFASPYHGVSELTWVGRLARLAGADMHIWGQPIGKFPVTQLGLSRVSHAFTQEWYNIKPTLILPGGGTVPNVVPEIMRIMGEDICLAAGGGVHGHPDGSRAGARAMRQAIDACMKGVSLGEYAETHQELAVALKTWGRSSDDIMKNYDLMK